MQIQIYQSALSQHVLTCVYYLFLCVYVYAFAVCLIPDSDVPAL